MHLLANMSPLYLLTRSLTSQEGFAYYLSRLPFIDLIKQSFALGLSPLYFIALNLWGTIARDELFLRSFSMLWFVVFIVSVHHIMIEIFSINLKKSYKYLLFFILNPILLYFAVAVNLGMMFLALSTVSCYFFLKKKYVLYGAVSIAAVFTHWSFLLVLILQGVYAFSISRKSKTLSLFHYRSIFLIILPALVILFSQSSFMLHGLITPSYNLKASVNDIKAVAKKNDVVYVKDPNLYFTATYYFDGMVYVYSLKRDANKHILIPDSRFITSFPTYPQKAFMIDNTGYFEALASY